MVDKESRDSDSNRVSRVLFISLIFLFSARAGAAPNDTPFSTAKLSEFAQSATWLNAMYYVRRGPGYDSLVVNDDYFIAKSAGRKDPLGELDATLSLFRQVLPVGNAHPQCQFPFRYKILRQRFALAEPIRCPSFNDWIESYAPTGLSLAYASQFIANPSSAFGHSFLVATSDKQVEGLWLTYNYAGAIPENANAIAYAWGGLTGWYNGDFSIMPFHQRLFQYGNIENRDLWLYPIRLSADELDLSLRRLWELVHRAKFTYYFLDENCAGALLRAFAAIIPEARNRDHKPLYVHPIEIIKVLDRLGRIGPPRLIPSEFAVLKNRVTRLTPEEKMTFKTALAHPEKTTTFHDSAEADAIMEYTAYVTRENEGELPDEFRALERSTYIQRAKFGLAPEISFPFSVEERAPHLAHDSMAADFGGSIVNDHWAVNFGYRLSLHGLLDTGTGFLDFSSFEFFKISVSANDRAIWLKELVLTNVDNFQPLWLVAPKGSWRVNLRFKENLLGAAPVDQYFEALLSYGAGFQIGHHLVYSMLASSINLGQDLPQSHFELGPEFGLLIKTAKLNASGSIGFGTGIFDGTINRFIKAGANISWSIRRNLSLNQENELSRLVDKNLTGYRSTLNLRLYF